MSSVAENYLSWNKRRAPCRKTPDGLGLFIAVHLIVSQQNREWLQQRAVKSKSHTIVLHSGPTKLLDFFFFFCPPWQDQLTSLLSSANNDSVTSVSRLHCVIDNLCSRTKSYLQHPFITSSALSSVLTLPQCTVLASTHVVNGMMVCRPLSAVRGEGWKEEVGWGEYKPQLT